MNMKITETNFTARFPFLLKYDFSNEKNDWMQHKIYFYEFAFKKL